MDRSMTASACSGVNPSSRMKLSRRRVRQLQALLLAEGFAKPGIAASAGADEPANRHTSAWRRRGRLCNRGTGGRRYRCGGSGPCCGRRDDGGAIQPDDSATGCWSGRDCERGIQAIAELGVERALGAQFPPEPGSKRRRSPAPRRAERTVDFCMRTSRQPQGWRRLYACGVQRGW